ncbi:MAG: hypothetical protein GXP30_09695 [Verrucomicrobia bacterium]|nr:hypothetical protein [Verrucomicrobiota bacterium]
MSNKESAEEESVNFRPKRKRWKWVVFALLAFFLTAGTSAYFAQEWLIAEMRSLVIKELEATGIYVDYSSAWQDPRRGAVVEKVFLYESKKKEKPLLTITNLGLSPSLKQWILERELSIKVTLENSEISMLVDGEEVERIERVNSVMRAGASGVEVNRFSAMMQGVNYDVTGSLSFGRGKDKKEKEQDIQASLDDKKKLLIDFSFLKPLGEWISVETEQGHLQVVSDFNIDASNLDGMIVNSRFSGETFVWHGVAFDRIDAKVTYSGKDRSVDVKSFNAVYQGKSVEGGLRYVMKTKTLQIAQLKSQADFLSWIRDYSGENADENDQQLALLQAPHLGLSGRLDFSDLEKSDLEVEFLDAAYVAVKAGEREISLKKLKGKLVFSEGKVRILEPGLSAKVEGGEFLLSGEGKVLGGSQSRSVNLVVSGKSFPWHGVTFDHVKADVIYLGKDRAVDVKSFDMSYRGKSVTGELRYVMPTKTLEIVKLESQVDFLKLIEDYSGKNTEEGKPALILHQTPHLEINGQVNFKSLEKSDLRIEFLNAADVHVETAGRQIKMEELKGKLVFAGGSVSTLDPGLSAGIADGEVRLSGQMMVMSDEKPYQAKLKLENVSVHEMRLLAGTVGDNQEQQTVYPGRLYFDFEGSGDQTVLVRDAKGEIKIEDALFYTMPLFGSLFATLNKAMPAFGKRKEGEKEGTHVLTATYLVKDELIRSDDLLIGGDLSQIVVKGQYDLQEKVVTLDGKAEFKGAVGLVTDIASHLLEVNGSGPLDNIVWKMKNLNATGVVKAGTKGVTDTSKEVLKLGGNTAKEAVKMTGKSVEGIGKGLKKVLPFQKKKAAPNSEEIDAE